ncbi:MAG: hypothetical protein V4726_16145 [Verrucomicrobiota bacterium]
MKILHSKIPLILVFLLSGLRSEAETIADNPTVSLVTSGSFGPQTRYTLSNFRVLNSSVTGTGTLYEADDLGVGISSGSANVSPSIRYDYIQVIFYEAAGQGFSGGGGRGTTFTVAYDVAVEAANGAPASPNRLSYTTANMQSTQFAGVSLALSASDGSNTATLKTYPGADISGFAPQFTVTNTVTISGGAPPFDGFASFDALYNMFIVPEAHSASLVLLSLGALACRRRR